MDKCPYLTSSNSCNVASSLIGMPVTVTPRTCTACKTKTDRPQALNVVTCSIAYQVAPSTELLNTLRQLHRATTFNKPGTCLRNVLKEIGIIKSDVCECDAYATEMDLWGTIGCYERRDAIIRHLNTQYVSWLDMVRVALAGYLTTGQLVDECLKRSKVLS